MAFDPWYKLATPRKEVREARSFNPDQFAIDDPGLPSRGVNTTLWRRSPM